MKLLVIGYLLLYVITTVGQTIEEPPPPTNPSQLSSLSISGHTYPVSANGDVHKSFMVQYGISRDTQLELQGFYDTYLLTERFRTSLVGKIYLSNKLYLFSGIEVETATSMNGDYPSPYQLGFVAGTGYDVNENFMIEIKSNVQLNNANIGVFGESLIEMPTVYTIGSKWKF